MFLFFTLPAVLAPSVLTGQERERRETEAREAQRRESEPGIDLSAPLEEVLEKRQPLDPVYIEVLWRRGDNMVATQIYGNGTGIWNRRSQFKLTSKEVVGVLESFRKAFFTRLPPDLGEESDMLKLQGKVVLTIGRQTQTVHQLATGDQSEALAGLAGEIMEIAESRAKQGVFASNLSNGLQKISAGQLAPEALEVVAVRRTDRPAAANASETEDGWLLRVSGRRVEARLFRKSRGYDSPHEMTLSEAEFRALLATLLRADVADLPQNAYAAQYTDLRVQVLDRVRDIAARPYADVTPETHGQKQKTFDRLYSDLRQLARKVLKEGRTAPAAG